ncbi:MAG: hypothetical protein GTO42_01765 [Candidatus Latescibacteria bacterium]|nr:hypothetical protein [Candidatus Latescibacterota bacterium]NIO27258.1 hypothetical protein [Candidatus Latescibacterota bacterium]NIO54782.1 hypothetical protein [Candidatus Latescibacterota bacterium]NIT00865.1 hypothetical protein [Candidatus Latescibacterota bacterium]NIT37788.1 hypothetical protein [Candidatus Latescibacterota bacterium]
MAEIPSGGFVALISDFGYGSFYVGVMKAAVYHAAPHARVVDITHDISPQAVEEGSFILSTVFDYFSPGSIFLAVVDPGVGGKRENLVFDLGDRYVVAPDNGLVSDLVARYEVDTCMAINTDRLDLFRLRPETGKTFLGRDVFAPAAGALASGTPLQELGNPADAFATIDIPTVRLGKNRIEGCGRYIDRFGNVLTNITSAHLDKAFSGHPFGKIRAQIGNRVVEGVQQCYSERPQGTFMVVLNSWNLIEVSVNRGRAADVLSLSDPCDAHVILEC